jgi:hypothetical protein
VTVELHEALQLALPFLERITQAIEKRDAPPAPRDYVVHFQIGPYSQQYRCRVRAFTDQEAERQVAGRICGFEGINNAFSEPYDPSIHIGMVVNQRYDEPSEAQ